MTRARYGELINRISACLELHGPLTRYELCEEIRDKKESVSAVLSRMRKMGEVHISGYARDMVGAKRYIRAIYKIGPGEDAKKPKASRLLDSRRSRKHSRLRVSSVFDLGLTRRQKAAKRRGEVHAQS